MCWVGLWILLAMAGVPAVHERARLFAFPPPPVGAELGQSRVAAAVSCKRFCLAADLKLL
jgi:hypothetical protein